MGVNIFNTGTHEFARDLATRLGAGAAISDIGIRLVAFLESRFPESQFESKEARESDIAEFVGELAMFLVLESEKMGFEFSREMATELGDLVYKAFFPDEARLDFS